MVTVSPTWFGLSLVFGKAITSRRSFVQDVIAVNNSMASMQRKKNKLIVAVFLKPLVGESKTNV